MKVLYVINGLGTGGSERSLAQMLPGLCGAGVDPVVVCFYRRLEGIQQHVIQQGFDVRFVEASSFVPRVVALRRMITDERPALIHTTHFEADLVGRWAAVGTRVPVVSSLVSTPYSAARFRDPRVRATKLALVRALDGWTARHLCARLHAVSQTAKDAAVRHLRVAAARINVVERGRDLDHMAPPSDAQRRLARTRVGILEDAQVIAHVGRHGFAKGQRYLIEAAGRLLPGHPGLVVLIAGRRGEVSDELDGLVEKLGLGEHVRFLGHRDDIADVLAAADVFAFPSLYEGLPGALIEAMALAVPIVASRIPAVQEIVEHESSALLAQPGSAADLADAIHRMLADPRLARSLARQARNICEQRFALDRCVGEMAALYRQVIADTAPANPGGE